MLPFALLPLSCSSFKDDAASPPDDAGAAASDPPDGADAQGGTFAGCNPAAPFQPPTYVAGLGNFNAMPVGGLRLSPDYLTAYFHASGRADSAGRNDLYTATRSSLGDPFGNITPIAGAGINTATYENDPTVSGDGLLLVFDRSGLDGFDHLYYAVRSAPTGPFTLVGPVYPPGAYSDTNPFLREDGQVLYLCSERASPHKCRIYRASRNDAGFDPPTPVEGIASTATDLHPVVTPDDLTLFFGSTRAGFDVPGAEDTWMATRSSPDAGFSTPTNVKELNDGDAGIQLRPSFVTADACALFLSEFSAGDGLSTGFTAQYVAGKPPL